VSAAIPVTVVGGYLGAGKTSLVNHVLRTAAGLRIAVLVNDFGALAVDADLIEAQSGNLMAIAGGCVCCAFGSDLMGALMAMAQRQPPPDRVLVETSGVALPAAVAQSSALVPGLAIDGVVVVADADTVRARAADSYVGDTVRRQLAEADLVVLNKADLAGEQAMAAVAAWLAEVAPCAAVVRAVRGQLPPDVLLGVRGGDSQAGQLLSGGAIKPLHAATESYASESLAASGPVDVDALARILAGDPGVIRAKGVLEDKDGSLKVLHVVGARHEVTAYAGGRTAGPGFACIGLRGQLDRARIARALGEAG
jgi:G3E family GTPase